MHRSLNSTITTDTDFSVTPDDDLSTENYISKTFFHLKNTTKNIAMSVSLHKRVVFGLNQVIFTQMPEGRAAVTEAASLFTHGML